MRIIVLAALLMAFTACGSSVGGDQQADHNQNPCGASVKAGMLCISPTIMNLRTASGNVAVSFSSVTGVIVQMYQTGTTNTDLERHFLGTSSIEIVKQLGLFSPNSGGAQSDPTGLIFVSWMPPSGTEPVTKGFAIQAGRILQDLDFPDVTYNAETTLDHAWLNNQPN
jgi:hypothetical protein